jgi:large subunit ribosomal protein L22
MSVKSELRSVRISPRKVGVVAALVRGRTVSDAVTILDHTPRRAAKAVKKAVVSAKANATHNHNYKGDSLYISEISVNAGPRYKRYRPAARGRANRYQHKTSHIFVMVEGDQRESKAAVKSEAKKETK